jgi:hypothetical protein
MTSQNTNTADSSWAMFIEFLSDEFTAKTGFGVYAYITPVDVTEAYQQYQLHNASMRLFVRDYVRHYA